MGRNTNKNTKTQKTHKCKTHKKKKKMRYKKHIKQKYKIQNHKHTHTETMTQTPPLPEFWEAATDPYGRTYYIDHKTQRTTWFHPCLPSTQQKEVPTDVPQMQPVQARPLA